MASNSEIIAILGILSASFPRFSATKETARVYEMMLQDIPGAELKAAALQCATKCDFFPSVHELRQEVINLRKRTLKIPSPAEAWQNLLNAHGETEHKYAEEKDGKWYLVEEKYQFLPMVEEVGRSLGWPDQFGTEMADRAHFLKEYERKVNEIMQEGATLPEVQQYIEAQQHKLLEATND
jgi:hypothetical protein